MNRKDQAAKTTVTGKNQVTVPARLVASHRITSGSQLEWSETKDPSVLSVRILASPRALARSLLGAGRSHLRKGDDPVAALIDERVQDDPAASPRRWR